MGYYDFSLDLDVESKKRIATIGQRFVVLIIPFKKKKTWKKWFNVYAISEFNTTTLCGVVNWNIELTHDLNFEVSFGGESLRIFSYAGVGALIKRSLDVLDDQRAIGENLLASVDGQNTATFLPLNGVNWVSSYGARNHHRFTSHNSHFIHRSDER